jgi:hypothetical protein
MDDRHFNYIKKIEKKGGVSLCRLAINNKWRLSWWTSRSFLESCLVLATTLSKSGDFQLVFSRDMANCFLKKSQKSLC